MAEYAKTEIDPREGLFQHSDFTGLRNNVGQEGFALSDLATAFNCDLNDAREIQRRKGYGPVVIAGVDRSLWSFGSVCLAVGSNSLKLINPNLSTTTLRTGLTANRELQYTNFGDRAFYSNGAENGVVQNGQHRTWGITPPGLPVATVTGGLLLAGDYQFAITYLRQDGQESGTGRAGTLTLTAAGGIALSSIPVSADPTVTMKNVYLTTVGGTVLYRRGVIPNAQTTFTINALQMDANPLTTQFLQPPPAGDFIEYYKGYMLVAKDNRIYPSKSYSPELFDYRQAIPFTDRITMIAALNNKNDSAWIGTVSQVAQLIGTDPSNWTFQVAAAYGVIPGSLNYMDGELLGDGSDKGNTIALFATTQGMCVGRSDGTFANLTQEKFAFPSMDRAASIVRRHRGIAQYVLTLEGIEVPANVAA